jgi:hypothetical protein
VHQYSSLLNTVRKHRRRCGSGQVITYPAAVELAPLKGCRCLSPPNLPTKPLSAVPLKAEGAPPSTHRWIFAKPALATPKCLFGMDWCPPPFVPPQRDGVLGSLWTGTMAPIHVCEAGDSSYNFLDQLCPSTFSGPFLRSSVLLHLSHALEPLPTDVGLGNSMVSTRPSCSSRGSRSDTSDSGCGAGVAGFAGGWGCVL